MTMAQPVLALEKLNQKASLGDSRLSALKFSVPAIVNAAASFDAKLSAGVHTNGITVDWIVFIIVAVLIALGALAYFLIRFFLKKKQSTVHHIDSRSQSRSDGGIYDPVNNDPVKNTEWPDEDPELPPAKRPLTTQNQGKQGLEQRLIDTPQMRPGTTAGKKNSNLVVFDNGGPQNDQPKRPPPRDDVQKPVSMQQKSPAPQPVFVDEPEEEPEPEQPKRRRRRREEEPAPEPVVEEPVEEEKPRRRRRRDNEEETQPIEVIQPEDDMGQTPRRHRKRRTEDE